MRNNSRIFLFFTFTIMLFGFSKLIYSLPVTNGLVAYWQFNNSGNDSWSTHGGTLQGNASYIYTQSNFQQSLSLDGSGDRFMVVDDNALDFSNAMTIVMWVKPENFISGLSGGAGGKWTPNGGNNSAYDFYVLDDGRLFLTLNTNESGWGFHTSNTVLVKNVWQQIAMSYSDVDNLVKFYVNGSIVYQQYQSGLIPNSGENYYIGGSAGGYNYYKGYIDEVKLFGRDLTQLEIQQEYNFVSSELVVPEPLSIFLLSFSLIVFLKRKIYS